MSTSSKNQGKNNLNFWKKLPKPVMVLAPLADVTDRAFRKLIAKHSRHMRSNGTLGGPDVFWTEFVSADGLCSRGRDALLVDLAYSEEERPIVAQFFTSKSQNMEEVARLAVELGFDGIDINMGCPDRSIEKQGAGAAMIQTPEIAQEVILGAKRGAGGTPVSVKTRVGFNKNELDTWLPKLLDVEPAVITVHARTRKELSLVPARWEEVKRAVDIRNAHVLPDGRKSETYIFGNGDVKDIADARQKAMETGADGVMLGRAIFGNPWLFNPDIRLEDLSTSEKLNVMIEHTKLFEELLGGVKNFAIMKKHYKAYVHGFDGAKELRMKLMDASHSAEVEQFVNEFLLSR